ncbi:PepSY-associated TM helix domain-containing protein [Acinetobacter sp. WZC-1]|uniref:PepSY-associated TM helix domain-containing protein n=1 Tax=Acinetobacter sp. WZC-1 TaxID=3459034 RepID=UPI00403DE627
MQKSIRQSMAWLHGWLGLVFGWLLFAIFLMGSASYYRHDISLWMQPQLADIQVNQPAAIQTASQYLQKNAADAQTWYINIATPAHPVNDIFWQKADGGYDKKTLDARTGQELNLSATQGGDFFYNFHFQLTGIPIMLGRMIVTFAAIMMLIILIAGIITHKKIFADFFTLRAFKGPRSYLDFHNVSSVIALPFFLTITFTGIAILFYTFFPWGMKKLYPDQPFQYFEEIRSVVQPAASGPHPARMLPILHFVEAAQKQWGHTEYSNIIVKNPNTSNAQITLTELKDQSITKDQAQIRFNAITGTTLANTRNTSAIATLNAGVYGLHTATFAQPLLRMALFISGLLGCLMIASGLLLWSLKRQLQHKQQTFHFGHYLVNRLNIATFVGLPIAMLSYLYSNRMITVQANGPNYEIYIFFMSWLLSLILALVTRQQYLWQSQLKIFIVMAICLPFFNLYTLMDNQVIQNIRQYGAFLQVDLMILGFAVLAIFLHQKVAPIQIRTRNKILKKMQQQAVQEKS